MIALEKQAQYLSASMDRLFESYCRGTITAKEYAEQHATVQAYYHEVQKQLHDQKFD